MMIYALITYINSKGKTIVKGVSSEAEFDAMIKKLDRRIEKGTCGGYIATTMES